MATRRAEPALSDEEFEASAKPKSTGRKATPAVKAEKPAPELDAEGNPVRKGRTVRGDRNHLARSIDNVLRSASGPVSVRDIAAAITYDDGSHPSSGAVAAALIRWSEQGYVTISQKPLAFKAFAGKHKNGDLDGFLASSREKRLKERKAAREALAV